MDAAITRLTSIVPNTDILGGNTLTIYYALPYGGGADFEVTVRIAVLSLLAKSAIANAIKSDAAARGFDIDGVIFPDFSYSLV